MKSSRQTLLLLSCCLIAFSGCKSPEERAMDQLDAAMKRQTHMMKHMQKMMERTAKEMEREAENTR